MRYVGVNFSETSVFSQGDQPAHARTPSQGPRFQTCRVGQDVVLVGSASGRRAVVCPARRAGRCAGGGVGHRLSRCRSGCGVGRSVRWASSIWTPLTVLLAPVLRVNRQLSRGRGRGRGRASSPDSATETSAPSSGGTSESTSPSVTSTEVAPGVTLSSRVGRIPRRTPTPSRPLPQHHRRRPRRPTNPGVSAARVPRERRGTPRARSPRQRRRPGSRRRPRLPRLPRP